MARPSLAIAAALGLAPSAHAQAPAPANTSAEAIADQLSNPLAAQISVQFQSDLEWRGGPVDDGFRYTLTLQPLVPFALDERWNVISRSNIPFVHQVGLATAADSQQTGLGSSNESLFLTPTRTPFGIAWGVGPIVAFPATADPLGPSAIALGPTAAIVRTANPWTYGILTHQVWALRGRASELSLQPEVAWSPGKTGTTLRATSESSYDWHARQWTIPVIVVIAQVVHVADQPFELALGPIMYLDRPDEAPRWGARASITLVILPPR
jgi:hypothetical protein